jgi:WD40 repeat protein
MAQPQTSVMDEMTWRELRLVLHEELHRLPEKYQAPLILCYFQGKTQDEAAQQLGWNKWTLKDRLEQGRDLLRKRLTRRGLIPSAALFATLLSQEAASAVPAALFGATLNAGMMWATGQTTTVAISTPVARLVEQGIHSLAFSKTKLAMTVFFTFGLLAAGAGLASYQATTDDPAQEKRDFDGNLVVPVQDPPPAPKETRPRTDRYGDPLPEGAIARLGTTKFKPGWIIYRAAVSGNRKLLATAGQQVDAQIWDLETGNLLRRLLPTPSDPNEAVAVSPNGALVAIAGQGNVWVFEIASGRKTQEWQSRQPWTLDFAPDSRTLAVGDVRGKLSLYDVENGRKIVDLQEQQPLPDPKASEYVGLHAVLFSPDGRLLASAGDVGELVLWDVAAHKRIRRLQDHESRLQNDDQSIRALAFSADGRRLASGGLDQVVRIWNVADGKLLRRCQGHEGAVKGLAFTKDGKKLVSGSGNCPRKGGKKERLALRLWDVDSGKELARWGECGEGVSAVFLSQDEQRVLTTVAGTLRQWDLATQEEIEPFPGHTFWVMALAFSPDGKRLATGGCDQAIRLWDVATATQVRRLIGCPSPVESLLFSRDGHSLFSASGDGTVRLWDVAAGRITHEFKNRAGTPRLALSPDGTLLASAAPGLVSRIIVWEVKSKKELRRFNLPQIYGWMNGLDFSPDGKWLATGTSKLQDTHYIHWIQVWDLSTGKELAQFQHGDADASRAFCQNGDWLASPKWGGDRLRQATLSQDVKAFMMSYDLFPTDSISFSPDGKMYGMIGYDNIAYLCETISGKVRRRFETDGWSLLSVRFSSNGKILATSDRNSTVLLWDVYRDSERKPPPKELSRSELGDLWKKLGGEDAEAAFAAMNQLVYAARQAVPFLQEKFQVAAGDQKVIDRLIAELDRDDFKTREKASAELEKLESDAMPSLEKALAGKPSLEVRRRIEALLAKRAGQEFRRLRAVEVLERIADPGVDPGADASRLAPAATRLAPAATRLAAIDLLKKFASGPPEARLTREAKASLERLDKRVSNR